MRGEQGARRHVQLGCERAAVDVAPPHARASPHALQLRRAELHLPPAQAVSVAESELLCQSCCVKAAVSKLLSKSCCVKAKLLSWSC